VAEEPVARVLVSVRVLLVEDQDRDREIFASVLRLAGAEVTAVSSGRQALRALKESPPDVLVSDVIMPDGDGLWLIREVRALDSGGDVPAIALTPLVGNADRRRILDAGFTAHLPKPVPIQELVQTVYRLAHRNAAGV